MHDAKDRPLAVGDTVLIPAIVTSLNAAEDYCNVSVQTCIGRRPDGAQENMGAINTGVMLRNLSGDTNDLSEYQKAPEAAAEAEAPATEAEAETEGEKAAE